MHFEFFRGISGGSVGGFCRRHLSTNAGGTAFALGERRIG
jgi:hypothetical protein